MAAVTRRQYKGAATQTTITTALAAGGTSITLASTTGFPSAAGVPFFVVISPGTASEEKCLATISGSVLTLTRAQDDTTAQSHSSGATIFPVFTADDADEANKLASTLTTRGDLLTMDSGPDFKRLALGGANTVLKSDGSDASWATIVDANITAATITGAKLANLTISDKTDSYTLVVGDRNTRIIMSKATATTVTVPNSVFSAGDVVFIANKGAGTCTVQAGAGVTVNGSGTALAQHGGGTLLATSASTFTFFPAGGGVGYGVATGGTAISPDPVISDQTYRVLQFTGDGTLTVTKAGLFDYFIAAGGGGGATGLGSRQQGGGGAGGVLTGTIYLDANASITVGAGGAGSSQGSTSQLGTFISTAGGGAGGVIGNGRETRGRGHLGGSNGGAEAEETALATPIAGTLQGNKGGNGSGGAGSAGGGGGKGAAGSAGSGATGGAGGAGQDVSTFIGGSSLFKAGGGGGGGTTGGAGGSSVGGAGGSGFGGSNAGANTASGGGGGAGAIYAGGAGGSGIVYVRFKV